MRQDPRQRRPGPHHGPGSRWRSLARRMAVGVLGALGVLGSLGLAGCSMPRVSQVLPAAPVPVYERETFDARSAFARDFVAGTADTCNAARRALLSQGYIASSGAATDNDQVQAQKRFQPEGEVHAVIEFHVVCAPSARGERTTVLYASAVHDRFTLKKSSTAASIGVSPLGSISVPIRSGSEALIKVGSETIASRGFYERFFELVEKILAEQKGLD